MRLNAVVEKLETAIPLKLAEPWDQVGLQVGRGDWDAAKALLCIDLTQAVLDEAKQAGANLIIAYHPLLFKPLERLTDQSTKSDIALAAAEHAIAVWSPHTALDALAGGVNDMLAGAVIASALGEDYWSCDAGDWPSSAHVRPITTSTSTGQYKLVTFVPPESVPALRSALSQAGAGNIGQYSQCSFTSDGHGTFLGSSSTNPTVGEAGRFEQVPEQRMEMVLPKNKLPQVITALHQAHPYEEPAFDIYATEPIPIDTGQGAGRVVQLPEPVRINTLADGLMRLLGLDWLDVGQCGSDQAVQTIGLCAGAGSSLLPAAGRVDAYLTGEMRHHDVLEATANGTCVMLAGHTQTERPFLPMLIKKLAAAGLDEIDMRISEADGPPSEMRRPGRH